MSARCEGRAWLFESTDLADHLVAKAACLGVGDEGRCPLFDACEATLRATQLSQWQSGIHGTWAGRLFGGGKPKTDSRAKPREHGTQRGWGQHRHYAEETCEPCRLAHNEHVRKTQPRTAV